MSSLTILTILDGLLILVCSALYIASWFGVVFLARNPTQRVGCILTFALAVGLTKMESGLASLVIFLQNAGWQ